MIPLDRGYSLDEGKLHTRHPNHPTVNPRRFRTVDAVVAVAGSNPPLCEDCYPQEKPKDGSGRMSRSRVQQAGGAAKKTLPTTSNGVEPTTRQQRPAWVRDSSPTAAGQDGGTTDQVQPVPADGDTEQPDRTGSHRGSEEPRED